MSRKEELRFSPLPPHFDRQPWDSFLFIVGNAIFPTTYSGPPLARAVSKHPTWKPPGCYEASGLYSALALPDLSSLSQLFWRCFSMEFPTTLHQNDILGSCVVSKLICHQEMAVWCRDSHCLQNRACCCPGCLMSWFTAVTWPFRGCSLVASGVSVLLVGTAQGMLKLEWGVWLLLKDK